MVVAETKSTHSQQHQSAESEIATQKRDRAFFSESSAEATAFFDTDSAPAIQTKPASEPAPFFHPAKAFSLQAKCNTCAAEDTSTEIPPDLQRMPAFESEEAGLQAKFVQRKPAFESDEDPIQHQPSSHAEPITPTTVTLQPKCDACKAEEKEQPEETMEGDFLIQKLSEFNGAGNGSDAEDPPVQFSLKIGQPGDIYEREADAMADRVVHTPVNRTVPKIQTQPILSGIDDHSIQRKLDFPPIPDLEKEQPEKGTEAEESSSSETKQTTPEQASTPPTGGAEDKKINLPSLEEEPAKEEEIPQIQTQGHTTTPSDLPDIQAEGASQQPTNTHLQDTLSQSKSGGSPVAPKVRTDMEQHFGHDLSPVRIHTDSSAVQMNRDLNAKAFTHENDIYFNAGEYQPESQSGTHLLAHEITHTIQQGAVSDTIQRYDEPTQDVQVEPRPERPNDGAEVEGRMNERINNDPNVQDQDDLSEEERQEAQNPNRGEVRQESSTLASSGASRPEIDRGAAAQQVTEAQSAQIDEQLQEQPAEAPEEASGQEEGAMPEPSEAEAAAQRALAAEQQSRAIRIPEQPEPFQHPRIEAPVDSAGESLPRNSQIDTQVRGLGYMGEMFREQGYEMKRHGAEQEIGAHGLEATLEREREDLANAHEGTAAIETHNEERREIAQQSREAHTESVERQQFVAEQAPDLASRADEGQADSGALASESQQKADRSQSEIPDDPDARADAEQQSGEMQDTAEGAVSMDRAITQTGERARQYEQDAAAAADQNQQSEAQITETDDVIAQTEARVAEMQATNADSQAQIENASPGPALIQQFAEQSAQSGEELIAASVVMEQELQAIQEEYLSSMAGIESREDAERRLQEEQEQQQEPAPEMSPEEQELVTLAGLSDEEQEQQIAEMDQTQRDGLLQALNAMIQRAPDQGTDETEGARFTVNTGASQALMGEQAPDPRQQQIQEVENQRITRVGGVLDIADQNMNHLTEAQQQQLANRLVAQSITDDIANINVLQMGGDMLRGMINPAMALQGVVGGFEKTLTGFANIGNWEAWQRDPLGNLLQIAADISTGLAMIFSSILGIAGLITALMVVLTILSWGTLSPITGPIIGWMGTVMTYAGWGAIIAGGLSVYFNYLAYIKNLHDAGTAETARELFGNTEQMRQNATDGFQGAMAVVEGIGAVKMGPSLRSGQFFSNVPRSPGQFARQTLQGAREGLSRVAAAPAAFARGARRLFGQGKRGLIEFKNRIQRFFARGGGPDVRRPRDLTPDSPHHARYDIEIQGADGHTYRRNRDGNGWCRFSNTPTGCGTPTDQLPGDVQQSLQQTPTSQQSAATQPAINTTSSTSGRPSPRQSEIDGVGNYPGAEEQVSFVNGREVRYGKRGSSRPDGFRELPNPPPRAEAIEVKNYDVGDPGNRANLYETIQSQYRQRLGNLPKGTRQVFVIDLRGQTVSQEMVNRIRRNILTVTSSSPNRVAVEFLT